MVDKEPDDALENQLELLCDNITEESLRPQLGAGFERMVKVDLDVLEDVIEAAVALDWFVKAIPFNFYGWLAVTFTLLFALGKLPFVGKSMRAAQRRVRETGELDSPHAEPIKRRLPRFILDTASSADMSLFSQLLCIHSSASIHNSFKA